jgi:hypothetical protein
LLPENAAAPSEYHCSASKWWQQPVFGPTYAEQGGGPAQVKEQRPKRRVEVESEGGAQARAVGCVTDQSTPDHRPDRAAEVLEVPVAEE